MIYLDNAASTPPARQVVESYARAAAECYGNPSSAHGLGASAARAVEAARGQVAALLRAQPGDLLFTSGGTEANALGLLGAAAASRRRHLVVSGLEHPAVLRNAELLVTRGHDLTVVAPGPDGVVAAAAIAAALRPETAVVALMLVNNELGTLQPVAEVARLLRGRTPRLHLHVDAVQAAGLVPIDVKALGADTVALSGHKLHGPKGMGALWLRQGARLVPLWDGGRQERGLRSGTENVPGAVALGCAAQLCLADVEANARVTALRDQLEALVFRELPEARRTVADQATERAPHIASFILPDLPAEPILHALEARLVHASAGSACASRTRGPSHVLAAIGVDQRAAVLRFSLSRLTTLPELAEAAAALREAVAEVRPLARRSARR